MTKIGALWTTVSKNGVKYLKGKIGNKTILVFVNKYKDKKTSPSFYIFEEEPPKKINKDRRWNENIKKKKWYQSDNEEYEGDYNDDYDNEEYEKDYKDGNEY